MEQWQQIFIITLGIYAFVTWLYNIRECRVKNNSFRLTKIAGPVLGAFVCADAVIFGAFWALVALVVWLLQDWTLFLLTLSIFWLVRSIGESIYWFNQQFSTLRRNPPEKVWFYPIFHNDSVWFVYQIFWQCITVITIITTVYLFNQWL